MMNLHAAARRFAITAALTASFAIAGCGGNSPSNAARKYVENLKGFNYKDCYQQLSHQDQLDVPVEQFLTQVPLAPRVSRDWFKSVLSTAKYEVGEAKADGDKANVKVTVTRVDLPLWERTIDATVPNADAAHPAAQSSLGAGTFPKAVFDDNIALVKQGEEWRLHVNFPQKEAAAKLRKQALEEYHKHDYDKAIETFKAALAELDKDVATGNDGLKYFIGRELAHVERVKAEIPQATAYLEKLKVEDVDMKMGASRTPGIFGKITNTGDKAIDEVQMTVIYYTGSGKRKKEVFREVHAPIATPLEFADFARPVLPFVPGEARNFGFRLQAEPDVMQKAQPDLTLTAIVFTDSSAPLPKLPEPSPSPAASPGAAGSPAAAASPASAPAAKP